MSGSAKRKESLASTCTSPPGFLIATIDGRYLAFEAEFVQGILTSEDTGFLQDLVVQGMTYRVVNLAIRLNLTSERRWGGSDVVLLADGKCRGCVHVQKVHGILEIHRSQILPLPAQFRGPERRWYGGMILFDHSVALVLNAAWLLDEQLEGMASQTESQETESTVASQGAIQSKSRAC